MYGAFGVRYCREVDRAARIWNRAALGEAEEPLAGDRALAAMLMAHGLVMNGGALHAAECLADGELEAALAGYELYGQHEAVSVLREAAACLERGDEGELDRREAELEAAYAGAINDDAVLDAAFKAHLLAHPELYAVV